MPENQPQPNTGASANPSGGENAGGQAPEGRSFDPDRPSDTEAAHQPNEGRAVRDPRLAQDSQDDRVESQVDASEGQDRTDLGEDDVGTTYEPSTVEVNRAREQGDGVGQKDLDYQRDPTGDKSYEEY